MQERWQETAGERQPGPCAAVGKGLLPTPESSSLAASEQLGQEEELWAPSTRYCGPHPAVTITATTVTSLHATGFTEGTKRRLSQRPPQG